MVTNNKCWSDCGEMRTLGSKGDVVKVTNKNTLEVLWKSKHWVTSPSITPTAGPITRENENQKVTGWGLPWWRSGWESACRCRGHGFEPWSGKIPHAAEQLGPCATTTEPAHLELCSAKRGCDSERPTHHDEEWPPLATTGESPHTETKNQHSQK